MSRQIKIFIENIAKTQVDRAAVRRWLDHLNATGYEIPSQDTVSEPALLIALAAKRCYMSFEPGLNPNVTKIRKDITEYLDNVLKSKHGSVCEHAVYTFAIEGVSRVFTGEMNRHRAGVAISEASMRYIRYNDIPYWLPTSITLTPEEHQKLNIWANNIGEVVEKMEAEDWFPLAYKKYCSQQEFKTAFNSAEKAYGRLMEIWKDELAPDAKFKDKKHITSMMRRIIPMGVATGGVWTLNMRALRHVIALRASEAAEEEILYVFSRIAKFMVENELQLFGDFQETPEGYWVPKYAKV